MKDWKEQLISLIIGDMYEGGDTEKAVEFVETLLSSQLKEVLGRLPKESEKDFESGGSSRDFGYYDSGFNDCLSQVKSVLAELTKLEEEK